MKITYQHANPGAGNESFLLRVRESHQTRTPCILVDAGENVDLDSLLGEDEYLAAVLLTHAHVDHYKSLGDAHRDGAPILTSPSTESILPDVFTEGQRHYGLTNTDALLDQVEGIDGWREVIGGTIRVHPVPAGHAPGACGFFLQIGEQDPFTALVTGDFTRRDAASYPGFEPANYFDIDAVFLTAATCEDFEDDLTDTVGTLVQRANEGSTTLCTASGLTGVHLATLLAGVDQELDRSVPVILAGQVAKLYEKLEYDHANIETIPTYSEPAACLRPGTVTIVGPEVPIEGSSCRLFREIEDDPNATLVQVQGGNTNAKDAGDARGTVSSTMFVNHPPEAVLDDVVETISPAHVIVEHQRKRASRRYKEKWDAYTWANNDKSEETLFQDGTIVSPPWVGEKTHSRVRSSGSSQTVAANTDGLLDHLSLPDVGRQSGIDLEAEGVDVARIQERLRTGQPVTASASETTQTATASGTANANQQSPIADGGLYKTTGPQIEEEVMRDTTDDGDDEPSSDDLYDTVSTSVTSTIEASSTDTSEDEAVEGRSDAIGASSESNGEDESGDGGEREETDQEHPREAEETDGPDEVEELGETETSGEKDDEQASGTDTSEQASKVDHQSSATEVSGTETTVIEVDPVVQSLAVDHADTNGEDLDTVVENAIEELLAAVLRGDDVDLEPDVPAIAVDVDPAVEQLIDKTMPENSNGSAFVRRTLCEGLGVDPHDGTLAVAGFDTLAPLVDAVAENDDSPVDDRDQIVQVALERYVIEQ